MTSRTKPEEMPFPPAPSRVKRSGRNPRTGPEVKLRSAKKGSALSIHGVVAQAMVNVLREPAPVVVFRSREVPGTMVLDNPARDDLLDTLDNPPEPSAGFMALATKLGFRAPR